MSLQNMAQNASILTHLSEEERKKLPKQDLLKHLNSFISFYVPFGELLAQIDQKLTTSLDDLKNDLRTELMTEVKKLQLDLVNREALLLICRIKFPVCLKNFQIFRSAVFCPLLVKELRLLTRRPM